MLQDLCVRKGVLLSSKEQLLRRPVFPTSFGQWRYTNIYLANLSVLEFLFQLVIAAKVFSIKPYLGHGPCIGYKF